MAVAGSNQGGDGARPRNRVPKTSPKSSARVSKTATAKTGTKSTSQPGRKPKYTKAQIRRNRIIALFIVVLAIIGMVLLIREVGAAFAKWQAAQAADAKAYQLKMEQRTFPAPDPCPPEALDLTLSHPSAVVLVGSGNQAEMTLRNAGETACTVVIDPAKVGIQILSGNQIIYNSTACLPEKRDTKQLLLDKGMTWKTKLNWDGLVQNADCSPATQKATAGTYRFHAVWDGAAKGEETVFVLQDPPPPPAEPADTPAQTVPENPEKQ